MDVLLTAVAGLVALGLVVVAAVLGTRLYEARRGPPLHVTEADRLIARQAAAAPASEHTLAERVAVLERAFPEWQVSMASLADQCEEVLDRAERKRRSARMAQQRAEQGGDAEQPEPAPADEHQARAQILAMARARRGGR